MTRIRPTIDHATTTHFRRTGGGFVLLLFAMLLGLAGCAGGPKTVPVDASMLGQVEPKSHNYRLRPGDIIQVDVFQEPIMTARQRILGDGTVSVGLIGRVKVEGMTVEEAANRIAALLNKDQLVNPQVTITVLAYSPSRFTVWGQVKSVGTYTMPPEETLFLPEALAMAGGPTVVGNAKRIMVTRRDGSKLLHIRVDAFKEDAQLFKIQEGDLIYIPETVF